MRKGLTVTLMTVAIAALSMTAMAMAPVIGNIPSPVVGDAESITAPTTFVYPDAINMNIYVNDPDVVGAVAPADIVWSYEIIGTAVYRINDQDSQSSPTEDDLVTPTAAREIATGAGTDPADVDGDPMTITVRNVRLSPIGGGGADPGGTAGIIDADTQPVTLYASDGSTAGSKTILFYTHNQHTDYLSPEVVNVATIPAPSTADGFATDTGGGGITYQDTAEGLCLTVPLTGSNVGWWWGLFGAHIPAIVQNNVYEFRLEMNGSQLSAGHVPFWDFNLTQYGPSSLSPLEMHGMNLFGCNYFFLDNINHDNAVLPTAGGTDFGIWWCPMPVSMTAWNDSSTGNGGPFDSANASDIGVLLGFRVLDTPDNGGISADEDSGQICMNGLVINRYDMANMNVVDTPYNTAFTSAAVGSNVAESAIAADWTVNYTTVANAMTIQATSSGNAQGATDTSEVLQINPGDTDFNVGDLADNYPVTWDDDTLYLVTLTVSAPTAGDADTQPDQFWLGADTPTNELISFGWVTGLGAGAGLPTTAQQTWKAFFWSNTATTVDPGVIGEDVAIWRPRIMVGNRGELNLGQNNNGRTTFHNWKVEEVSF